MLEKSIKKIEKTTKESAYFKDEILKKKTKAELQSELLLKGLDVKKILIGGMYIDSKNNKYGCLIPTINVAKELNIKVVLSNYTLDINESK